jgi:HEPN domain-containing protein
LPTQYKIAKVKKDNSKAYKEWFLQADYDYDTAVALYKSGRYLYTVFMCHLTIEMALKGLWIKELDTFPTKTHNLVYLVEKIGLKLSEEDADFIGVLNVAAMPSRYPEDLKNMMKLYPKDRANGILINTKKLLKWIKEQ